MLRSLREVNVDHLQVGWFQASTPLPFMTEDFIFSQHDFQQQLPQSVVLVYGLLRLDLISSIQGIYIILYVYIYYLINFFGRCFFSLRPRTISTRIFGTESLPHL